MRLGITKPKWSKLRHSKRLMPKLLSRLVLNCNTVFCCLVVCKCFFIKLLRNCCGNFRYIFQQSPWNLLWHLKPIPPASLQPTNDFCCSIIAIQMFFSYYTDKTQYAYKHKKTLGNCICCSEANTSHHIHREHKCHLLYWLQQADWHEKGEDLLRNE